VSPYSSYLVETFVTLVCVCALAFVVLWTMRRLGGGRPSGPLELRGYLPLDARRAIALVQVGEVVYVVGVAEGGFTKIGEVAARDLPAGEATRASPFAEVLARALRASGRAAPDGGRAPSRAAAPPDTAETGDRP
jgi:flagellar biogenesis protein FliO